MTQRYDAYIQWNVNYRCNLKCDYCLQDFPNRFEDRDFLLVQEKHPYFSRIQYLWSNIRIICERISQLGIRLTLKEIYRRLLHKPKKEECINVEALLKTLDETNLVFRINILGGEAFILPNIVEACERISEKHFLSFNTNLITPKFREFINRADPSRIVHINASLHFKELEKHRLTDRYIDNFLLCQKKGISITAAAVAHPSFYPEVDGYREIFAKKGIKIKFDRYIGFYNGKLYPESYTPEELEKFGLTDDPFMEMYRSSKGKLCNAGYNAAVASASGNVFLCPHVYKKLGNMYEKIQFEKTMIKCPVEHCLCPINLHDEGVFQKAIEQNQKVSS
jgi:MoaA/NifB/PqqE/SkfB family radical SAM enzyme